MTQPPPPPPTGKATVRQAVLDLLPAQQAAFAKEDGEQVVDATGQRIS